MLQTIGQALIITIVIAISVVIATDGNEVGIEICKQYLKSLMNK